MTEAEWLACDDPAPMLEFQQGRASVRKLRLFNVACCLRIWHLITDERSRRAVEVAERAADGWAGEGERELAEQEAYQAAGLLMDTADDWEAEIGDGSQTDALTNFATANAAAIAAAGAWGSVQPNPELSVAESAVEAIAWSRSYDEPLGLDARVRAAERAAQVALVRDIFGPLPFRPVASDPRWLTSTAVALAESIYAERAFDRLPILADALEDAGCDSVELLAHCRSDGPHVRGCWAVDLVLGKA